MATKQKLGELLVQKGLVTQEQINDALRAQVGGNRRLGYLLIKMGILSSDQLLETLSEQLDLPIITVGDEFSPAVKRILPRYLCRKYSVVPISSSGNNVLTLAMVDPLDEEAIADVENFTAMVVRPVLAREQDISAAITGLLPFSLADVFNPQVYNRFAKVATVAVLVLFVAVGSLLYRYIQTEKYGTISRVENTQLFKNHDLIIGVEEGGRISIYGHGAFESGFYSVTFNDFESFKSFVEQKKKKFSEKQYDWIRWVLAKETPDSNV